MKIKISKSQWEKMGKEAGWMKKEAGQQINDIGTIDLFVGNVRDAREVGSLPIHIELNIPNTPI